MSTAEERRLQWQAAMDEAEQILTDTLRTLPHDEVVSSLEEFSTWATRYRLAQIARSARILYSLGYSKSSISLTMGLSRTSLLRALADAGLREDKTGHGRPTERAPEHFIDISDQFDSMPSR